MLVGRYFCDPFSGGAAAGECYWYTRRWTKEQLGIYLHLWSVFPGGTLAVLQFIPSIRDRFPKFHRFAGYVCWFLGMTAAISSLMLAQNAFGGTRATHASCLSLALITVIGHLKAYRAIKAFRLDEHRAWMIRTWVNMGSIITIRMLIIPIAKLISLIRISGIPGTGHYTTMELPCEQIFYMLNTGKEVGNMKRKPNFFDVYGASCAPNNTLQFNFPDGSIAGLDEGYKSIIPGAKASVDANILAGRTDLSMAAIHISFGISFALAILLHVVFVEWYLWNDNGEAERLQKLGDIKRRARERETERTMMTDTIKASTARKDCMAEQIEDYKEKSLRVKVREVKEDQEGIPE